MLVNKTELVTYLDIDGTLINKDPIQHHTSDLKVDYYGVQYRVQLLHKNIEFVKTLHARGWQITAHSHNGWQWAENVINVLGLKPYIYEVKSKPFKYIDDQDCHSWMGTRINLHEEKDNW